MTKFWNFEQNLFFTNRGNRIDFFISEEAVNLLRFAVDIDVVKARPRRETGHRGNCPHERIQESGANRRPDVTDRERESCRRALKQL